MHLRKLAQLTPIWIVLVLAAAPRPTLPCSVCSCGDPLLSAGDAAGMSGQLRLGLESEYLSARAAGDLPGSEERLDQLTLRAVAVYSPDTRVNLVLQVPLVRKSWQMLGGAFDAANPIGLGDVDLGGRWFFFQSSNFAARRRQFLALTGGTSLPTGPNDLHVDEHAQLGIGSFGPYLGLLYRLQQDPWNAFASVSARAHGTNGRGYHYGDALVWTVAAQVQPWDRVALGVGVDGRLAAHDTSAGTAQENTGGLLLSAAPAIYLGVTKALWISLRAQLPIYAGLGGDQKVGPTWIAGFQYQL